MCKKPKRQKTASASPSEAKPSNASEAVADAPADRSKNLGTDIRAETSKIPNRVYEKQLVS
jgi:hypothetical protein